MAKKYKCRVEYLESTGTQWIDTGVNVDTSTDDIKLYFELTETALYKWFFGEYDTNARLGLGSGDGANKRNFLYQQSATKVSDTQMYSTQHLFEANLNGGFLDGTKIRNYTSFASTSSIYLFNINIDSASDYRCKSKIWGYRHKRNGVLIRDLIPVLDLSGKPAMYDQVSGKLFYNKGTGEFAYGRQIIPVEYLESTGTQYIDTGFKGKNNLHYKTKVNFTTLSTGGSNGIGGEYLANASAYIGMVRANGHYTYLFNNTAVETTTTIYANTDYEIDSVMDSGNQVLKVNGETISTGTISGTFTSTRNIFLYAICSTNDAADVYGSLKMYYCQIYDNGVLVRDFIPCIDENLTPFMFDLVTNTCYINAGTGQFKVGSNVEKMWGGKKLRRKLALALANLKKKRKYYCEVEYLENTGSTSSDVQYIDTGVKWVGDNHKISIGFFKDDITTAAQTAVCGFQGGTGNNELFAIYYGNLYVYGGSGDTTGRITYGVWQGNVHNNIDVVLNNDTVSYVLNGGSAVSYTARTNYVDIDKTMYLFMNNNSTFQCLTGKIYYCKIWENDILVRDFIPVLDWNYVPCMYDRVTEQLFYNVGTGNFTVGREIHYVDYLESTGVEYIDTGIKFDGANTKIELKTYEDSLTRRHSICGDDGNFFYYFRGTGNWAVGYNGTAANIDTYMSVGDNVFVMDKNNVYINGVLAKTYTASSNVSAYNALLFNRKTSLVDNGAVTMYYCKIWNNNVLVRDYIPAIDENGVGFMLDRVSHTCFLNQGTGAFKYPAREVEYLQSDGARAIIAGVTVDDTCGYDVKWMALNADDRIILGTKGSGDSRWVLSGGNNPNVNISWNTSSGGIGLGLNKIQTAQMNYFNDRKRILNDTPLTDITQTLSANASTYNVGIFAGYWGASTISLYSTCRIYYAKISKGTELIRDFIPMVKDGSPCLYDKVGGLYYFGTGTGSFTTGKIIESKYE